MVFLYFSATRGISAMCGNFGYELDLTKLTDEEKAFEETRKNLEKVISKMLVQGTLSREMINDTLINNLTKYHLDELKDSLDQKIIVSKDSRGSHINLLK